MKRKFYLAFIIAVTMLCIVVNVNANVAEAKEIEVNLENDILSINIELQANESDVISELKEQECYYQRLYLQTSNNEDKEKIESIIDATQELIDEYETYINPIQTKGSFHAVYTPAVASVVAYF